jgi:hypothetical protein
MNLKKIIKNNWILMLGPLILFLVVFVNVFPKGYVFSGGDTLQFIEAKNNLKSLFYDWQGRTCLFYAIFYLLDIIGISDAGQLSWYLGIFIFGSYFSFYIFSQIVFKPTRVVSVLTSLFYALNLYTLLVFTTNWGFSHFQTLYIFVPLIFGFLIKFLTTKKYFFGFLFCLVLLLASSGFGNPAFALSLFIILMVLTVFLIIFKIVRPEKDLFVKLFAIFIFSMLANAYWILPIIPAMKGGVESVYASNVLDLNWWITHTSVPVFQMFRLLDNSGDFFPDNFPYPSLLIFKNVFSVLSYLAMASIIFAFTRIKKVEVKNRKYFFSSLGTLVVLIMLTARVREPFETINYFIFNIWGLNTLRSYEKFAIYLPFFFAVLLLLFMIEFRQKRWTCIVIFLILLMPLPFYLGKLQQNLSYRFSASKVENKDYRKSSLSFLVKIPEDYYRIRNLINSDLEKYFIATLPATPNDGSGIAKYPKWKFYGIDITRYLYDKKFIDANSSDFFGKWNLTQEFNDNYSGNYEWIIDLLGMINSKYIIYHKDAPDDQVQQSLFKMDMLEQEGLIKKINDNDFFNLYEIDSSYRMPYISWQKENYNFSKNIYLAEREIDVIRKNSVKAQFQEINPKKFEITMDKNITYANLVIAEPYNINWKAYAIDKNGKRYEIKSHFMARGYANGWNINNKEGVDKIIIEYYPERLMWYGLAISVTTTLFLIAYLACPIAFKLLRKKPVWKK